MYIKRSLEIRVKEMAEHFPVVLVCGARQGAVLCMSSSIIPLDAKNKLVPIKAI